MLSLAVAIITGSLILGGIKRIGLITSYIVPIMSLLYMLSCMIIIGLNYEHIKSALTYFSICVSTITYCCRGSWWTLLTITTGIQGGYFLMRLGWVLVLWQMRLLRQTIP